LGSEFIENLAANYELKSNPNLKYVMKLYSYIRIKIPKLPNKHSNYAQLLLG